jgi:hypothetical protein
LFDALEAPVHSWSQNAAPDVLDGARSRQRVAIEWFVEDGEKALRFSAVQNVEDGP